MTLKQAFAAVAEGRTVKFRPVGNSMSGRIESGQLVTVEPVRAEDIQKNDIVLCKVNGNVYVHLVKAISGNRFQIGNNRGRINGWTNNVVGKVIEVV